MLYPDRDNVSMLKELKYYVQTTIFGILVFAGTYYYTTWLGIPNVQNKALADTAALLISFSMLLTAICYFWNFFDSKIIYRKYLGLVGFAFGLAHVYLSRGALNALQNVEKWQQGAIWPAFTGVLATLIFLIMTIVSNKLATKILGGKQWKRILRLGYIALVFVLAHVALLKSGHWVTWIEGGMNRAPSMSLIVSGVIIITVLMRIVLFFVLLNKKATTSPTR